MIKKIIIASPFFILMNNIRRKGIESRYCDFLIRPLVKKLEEWPMGLTMDTTNRCNAKCKWCPHPQMKHDFKEMDWDLFKTIIDDYASVGGTIRLGNFGEPLMDKLFVQRVKYVREKKTIQYIDMNTNLFFLDLSKARELVDLQMNFHVSLDEVDEKLYEEIKGIEFKRVIENLFMLAKVNSESRNPVRISVKFKTIQSLDELKSNPIFKKMMILCDEGKLFMDILPISKSDCINNMGGNFNSSGFLTKYFNNGKVNRTYKDYNLTNPAPCSAFWRNLVIMPDGQVVQCCVDVRKKIIVGDLNKQTVKDIWLGESFKELRKRAVNRERSRMELCAECDLHQGWQYLGKYFSLKGEFYKEPHKA